MKKNTVIQHFYSASLLFYSDKWHYNPDELVGQLEYYFPNAKVIIDEISCDDGDCSVYLSFKPKKGYDSYFETECEYEPYHPAVPWLPNGDPGYPEEGGVIYCYDDTKMLLDETLPVPFFWDYEIYEEDFQNEKDLWESMRDDEY